MSWPASLTLRIGNPNMPTSLQGAHTTGKHSVRFDVDQARHSGARLTCVKPASGKRSRVVDARGPKEGQMSTIGVNAAVFAALIAVMGIILYAVLAASWRIIHDDGRLRLAE